MADDNNTDLWLESSPGTNPLKKLIRQLRLVWRLLRDRRVPLWLKVVPFLSLLYLLVPADFVPDLLLGLGQLDDLAVIALGVKLFVELAPPGIVHEHWTELVSAGYEWKVIDGEAEQIDEF